MKMATRVLRRLTSSMTSQRRLQSTSPMPAVAAKQDVPVMSWNEWDPLEEVIVGRAEGQRVPYLNPDIKAKMKPDAWKWLEQHAGQPHDAAIVKKASEQIEEFCNVLRMEGVRVRRPEPMAWDEMGDFKTPNFTEGGIKNTCPRDGIMVVGDEIIESAMGWRSRMFELNAYKKLFMEYFRRGARWTSAPKPSMADSNYRQDFPYEDEEARTEMMIRGEYVLTEEEPIFDAAAAVRFGADIFCLIGHCTNRTGIEWLRRHLAPQGIRVHTVNTDGIYNCHADATLQPLKPGVMVVVGQRPCLTINEVPTRGYEWFTQRGWDVYSVPEPVNLTDTNYCSKWILMNNLSLDEERILIQKGEEPLKKLYLKLGMKPIEVDLSVTHELGGAFHCWTVDVKRKGSLQNYF